MKLTFSRVFSLVAATVTLSTVAFMTTAAQAITFTQTDGPFSPKSDATTIDFDDLDTQQVPNLPGTGLDLGNGVNLVGGQLAVVDILDTAFVNGEPTGSTGNFVRTAVGRAIFTFEKKLNYFGLLRGAIQDRTFIRFLDGGTEVGRFNGSAFASQNQTKYVNFFVSELGYNSYDFFDRVEIFDPFVDGGKTFSFDNVAYEEIPTPALLPGIIGLGAAALRKRKQAQEESSEA